MENAVLTPRDTDSPDSSTLKKYGGEEFERIPIKKPKTDKNKVDKAKAILKPKPNFKFKDIDEVSQAYVLILGTQKI